MKLNTRLLAFMCLAVCLAMLYAGLRPKGFRLKNEVGWLPSSQGLSFGKIGIAFTDDPAGVMPDTLPIHTIELAATIPAQPRPRLASILYLWDKRCPVSFQLLQWREYLIVRKQYPRRFKDKRKDFHTKIEYGQTYHILITSQPGKGAALYVNGEQILSGKYSITDTGEVFGRFVLGNNPAAECPWRGQVHALALEGKPIDQSEAQRRYLQWSQRNTITKMPACVAFYAFDENTGRIIRNRAARYFDLRIPEWFTIPQKQILIKPWRNFKWDRSFLIDTLINFFGFIPFGIIFFALLRNMPGFARQHALMLTLAAGMMMSLFVEAVQAFMPTRCSQLSDLIINTLGTVTGVFTAKLILLPCLRNRVLTQKR